MDGKKSKQKNCTFSITEGDDPRIEAFWSKQSNKSSFFCLNTEYFILLTAYSIII